MTPLEATELKRKTDDLSYDNSQINFLKIRSLIYELIDQILAVSSGSVTKEVAQCCNDYNDQLRAYVNCLKDLRKSAAFVRNLDDKKVIKLNLNQLSALGF